MIMASNDLRTDVENWLPPRTGNLRTARGLGLGKIGLVAALTVPTASAATTAFLTTTLEQDPVTAAATSQLMSPLSRGQSYVRGRLDSMLKRSDDPSIRAEYPTYPSAATIALAQTVADRYVTKSTPTPSIVPGDGGLVQFIWHKGGWDLMLSVDENGVEEVWARHRLTRTTVVSGDEELDLANFLNILATLTID